MIKTLKRCASFICAMIFSVFILNIETPLNFSIISEAADNETADYNVTLKFENEDGTPFDVDKYSSRPLYEFKDGTIIYSGRSWNDNYKWEESKYNMYLSDGTYTLSKYMPLYGSGFDYSYTQKVSFTVKKGEITYLDNVRYCRQEDEHTIVFTFVPVEPEHYTFTSYTPFYTSRKFSSDEIIDIRTPSAASLTSSLGAMTCRYDSNTGSIKIVPNGPHVFDSDPGYMLYVFLSDGELYRLNIGCNISEAATTTIMTTTTTSSTSKKTTSAIKPTTSRTTQTAKPTTTTTAAPEFVINRNSLTLENGEQFTITANQNDLTFVSNNKNVAVVSKSGVVTAVGEGSATISVINSDGDAAQLKLTVVKPNSIGDCNDDGTFDIADIVVLQKWLLKEDDLIAEWKAADIDGDGILDVYDLCLMRKRIVQQN